MSRFHKSAWLASGCVAALALAAPAFAQSAAAEPEAEAIVVTGIRASINNALEAKRLDTRVSDGVSSEDLGKFPSENITEAIQRISGVQMSNINGRGATISIRGLGPQYSMTTVNGQTFKSADFTDGFRYDIIQTELANAIQVIKSPTADMDAGGLSGTVNIETTKPLNYHDRQIVVTAKGQNSDYAGGKITPKFSASYVDQLADGTLGVYLNLGYQKLTDRADYMWMDRWTTQTIGGATVNVPRRPRYRRIDRDTERLMASGGIQWKPSDSIEVDASAIFARDTTDYDVNQQVFLFSTSRITVNQVANGTGVNATATDFTMENNRQHEDRNLQSQMYTLSTNWTGENGWAARVVGNYTKGKTYWREAAAILGVNIPSATIDLSDPNDVKYSITGVDLANTALYAPATLSRNEYPNGATRRMQSTEWSGQFDLYKDVEFGPFSKLSAGAKYRHETFKRYITRHDMVALLAAAPAPSSPIFPAMATNFYRVTGFLNNSSSIPNAWVGPDLAAYDKALAAAGIVVPDIFAPEGSYDVDRFMPSVYAMATIDTELGSMPVRGNIGVRYEHTRQKVLGNITADRTDGYEEVKQKIGSYTVSQTYNNLLPSMNLVFEPASKLQVRFAAAKVLVRPIMDSNTSMAQTSSQSTSGGLTTVSVDLGQANLKALTANQLDLGVEWYFQPGSAIAINGFYKWIKNGTFSRLICPASFNGVTLATDSSGVCMGTDAKAYDITQTLNDPSTIKLKGFEVSWNQSFDSLLPVDGFGISANYTRVYPEKLAIGTGYTVRNLSKVTWNVTPYWENEDFNIRASINHRSGYEQNSADSFFAREGHTVRARTQIDVSGGWSLNEHISVSAGVINLNNSSEEAFRNDPAIWQESSYYGRSYYASVTARF